MEALQLGLDLYDGKARAVIGEQYVVLCLWQCVYVCACVCACITSYPGHPCPVFILQYPGLPHPDFAARQNLEVAWYMYLMFKEFTENARYIMYLLMSSFTLQ